MKRSVGTPGIAATPVDKRRIACVLWIEVQEMFPQPRAVTPAAVEV